MFLSETGVFWRRDLKDLAGICLGEAGEVSGVPRELNIAGQLNVAGQLNTTR